MKAVASLSLPPLGGVPAKRGRGAHSRSALFAALFLATAPLAACAGFEPLYAMPNVTPALRSVDVVTPPGRVGFLLREQINDELARDTAPARYRLNLTVAENRIPRGIRVNNVASEVELDLRVGYDLIENATGKSLLRGQTAAAVFYAATDAPYAGIASQQDAQERAASQAAVQIRLALSRQFAAAARPPGRAAP
jgi:LPS-assembly lipoprotein